MASRPSCSVKYPLETSLQASSYSACGQELVRLMLSFCSGNFQIMFPFASDSSGRCRPKYCVTRMMLRSSTAF